MNKEKEQPQIQVNVPSKPTVKALETVQKSLETLNAIVKTLEVVATSVEVALRTMGKMPATNFTARDINVNCEQMNKPVVDIKKQENEIFTEE